MSTGNPSLSLKSFAELLSLPVYRQSRILHEQKYPKDVPQVFRTPYYQVALTGIRAHYRTDGEPAALAAARAKARSLRPASKRDHNLRVIDAFFKSLQARRRLAPVSRGRATVGLGQVEIRANFDLVAKEDNGTQKFILYNFRAAKLDEEIARTALELAHWSLAQLGQEAPLASFEYIDLASNTVYTRKGKPRARTMKEFRENAKIISTLWPGI